MRLRLIRAAYQVAWVGLAVLAPLHRGRGRGAKAVLSHRGEVLLVRHTYGRRRWELPGGGLHRGESALEGIRRELREELSVAPAELRLIAVGCGSESQPRRAVSVFAAELRDSAVTPDPREIDRAQWWPADALPQSLGWQVAAAVSAWRRAEGAAPVELP